MAAAPQPGAGTSRIPDHRSHRSIPRYGRARVQRPPPQDRRLGRRRHRPPGRLSRRHRCASDRGTGRQLTPIRQRGLDACLRARRPRRDRRRHRGDPLPADAGQGSSHPLPTRRGVDSRRRHRAGRGGPGGRVRRIARFPRGSDPPRGSGGGESRSDHRGFRCDEDHGARPGRPYLTTAQDGRSGHRGGARSRRAPDGGSQRGRPPVAGRRRFRVDTWRRCPRT